jgi:hypothetical protein
VFDDFKADEAHIVQDIATKHNLAFTLDRKQTLSYDFAEARKQGITVMETLSSETRYSIRRSMKVFHNEFTTEWAEDTEHAFAIFDELITLYNQTWKSLRKRSVFDSIRFTNFQKAIIPILLKRKELILFRVKSKEFGTLGCLSLLVDNGVGYGYQLGINHFENVAFQTINKKRLRTGFILHTLCMEECLKRGIMEYNFAEGLHGYKRELTNIEGEYTTVSLRKNSKPLLRDAIFKLHKKVTEKKKTPLIVQLLIKAIRSAK